MQIRGNKIKERRLFSPNKLDERNNTINPENRKNFSPQRNLNLNKSKFVQFKKKGIKKLKNIEETSDQSPLLEGFGATNLMKNLTFVGSPEEKPRIMNKRSGIHAQESNIIMGEQEWDRKSVRFLAFI